MSEIAEASVGTPEVPVSTEFSGELAEGWMEKYGVAEDLRGDQTLQTTKHIGALASQLVNAQKMIGKNTTSIPNEDSPQTEWDNFHDNFRPATAGDYEINHAEGVGEIDEAAESGFKDFVHSEGLRPSTVQKLTDMYDSRIMQMREAHEQAEAQKLADADAALSKKWGAAKEERLLLANRMISENASEENKAEVLGYIGNNPIVADFLANIASKFVEHKIIDASITQKTPIDALAKADDLRNTPGYITGELANTSPARYKQITQEISALMADAYPEQKA
ncbi:MAG: hypothetical protein V3V88_03555 [Dehalococcoidia bacterium]